MQEIHLEHIQRHERAEDAAGHQEQENRKLFFACLDFARATGCGKGHDAGHEHHHHADAVHADVKGNVQRINPWRALSECIAVLFFE